MYIATVRVGGAPIDRPSRDRHLHQGSVREPPGQLRFAVHPRAADL